MRKLYLSLWAMHINNYFCFQDHIAGFGRRPAPPAVAACISPTLRLSRYEPMLTPTETSPEAEIFDAAAVAAELARLSEAMQATSAS